MVRVIRNENEPIDLFLKRFKSGVKKANIIGDYRKHEFFIPKSLYKKNKSKNKKFHK